MLENNNNNWVSMTDKAIMKAIGASIRYHRLKQNKTQAEVARDAGINRWTVIQLENGGSVTLATLIQVIRVLSLFHLLEAFTVREEISPIAYARLKEKNRQRARPRSPEKNSEKSQEW